MNGQIQFEEHGNGTFNDGAAMRAISAATFWCLALLWLSLGAGHLAAANFQWSGSVDGFVANSNNWVSPTFSGAPPAASTLEFPAGATRLAVTNNIGATRAYGGITFSAGASAYTLNGNSTTITLGNSGVTNNSTSVQTINWLIRVYNGSASGATYFNAASGGLVLGGGFNTGGSGVGWISTLGSGGITING